MGRPSLRRAVDGPRRGRTARRAAGVQRAPPAVLYRTPADLEVARFVGEAVVLSGEARGPFVSCALGQLEVRDATLTGPVQVMIRPEQVRMLKPATNATISRGTPARVLASSSYGPDTV